VVMVTELPTFELGCCKNHQLFYHVGHQPRLVSVHDLEVVAKIPGHLFQIEPDVFVPVGRLVSVAETERVEDFVQDDIVEL